MTITIEDIAEISGFSTATVSRVINSPEKVSDKTRKKVQDVIKKYDYKPNKLAQDFSSNRSNNIALFIYDIINPFFTRLIKELNKLAFDCGYSLIICDTENERERELKYIDYINRSKFAGLILTEGISGGQIRKLDDVYPLVCIDRDINCERDYLRISTDNVKEARRAVEYLVNLNHKKIACIVGPEDVKTALERKNGYKEVVQKYDLPVDDRYMYTGDFKKESGVEALEYFLSLEEIPTAIFCSNDLMAEGVLSRALSLNIDIPGDLSIVGFDGTSKNIYRKLTTVKQDISAIAEKTMEALVKLIKNEKVEKKITTIPGQLVIGDTCQKL